MTKWHKKMSCNLIFFYFKIGYKNKSRSDFGTTFNLKLINHENYFLGILIE